jgi:hypothetical protein
MNNKRYYPNVFPYMSPIFCTSFNLAFKLQDALKNMLKLHSAIIFAVHVVYSLCSISLSYGNQSYSTFVGTENFSQ